MFQKADRFPFARPQPLQDKERQEKEKQDRERSNRIQRRNQLRELREGAIRNQRHWSWVKPFLKACQQIRSLPNVKRHVVFQLYIPFQRLPRSLEAEETVIFLPTRNPSSRLKNSDKNKGKQKQETEGQSEQANEDVGKGKEVPVNHTNWTLNLQGPMAAVVVRPSVPITTTMGQAGDRTTNVAPLPMFNGWLAADPDQHMSQFLTACVANNGRTEDVWLRWFPATLKDIAFEWYNRQPINQFQDWTLWESKTPTLLALSKILVKLGILVLYNQ